MVSNINYDSEASQAITSDSQTLKIEGMDKILFTSYRICIVWIEWILSKILSEKNNLIFNGPLNQGAE